MKRRTVAAVVLAGSLTFAAATLYARRPRGRMAGVEGLEDEAVVLGFERVANMPQMRLLRRLVAARAASLKSSGWAVDLGCGPGHLAVRLAQTAPELKVIGVDLAPGMLAAGEERAAEAGLSDRVVFRRGDAAEIPLPDSSVDLVVSTLSLHHWSDPVVVLDEVARVLRPGGSYLIADLRRDLGLAPWSLLWFATHVVVPRALRRAGEPLNSRNAAYTPLEAAELAGRSALTGWRVNRGPLWLIIEGTTASPDRP